MQMISRPNTFKKGQVVRLNDGEDLKNSRLAKVNSIDGCGVDGKIIYPLSQVGQLIFWHMNHVKIVSGKEYKPLLNRK